MARTPTAGGGGKVVPLRPARACPICARPLTRGTWPFCSKRCADIDLNRWLSGAYAIPVAEAVSAEDDESGS